MSSCLDENEMDKCNTTGLTEHIFRKQKTTLLGTFHGIERPLKFVNWCDILILFALELKNQI
jgi:hypothetical protein